MSADLAQLLLIGPLGPLLLFIVLVPTLIGISAWHDRRRRDHRKKAVSEVDQ